MSFTQCSLVVHVFVDVERHSRGGSGRGPEGGPLMSTEADGLWAGVAVAMVWRRRREVMMDLMIVFAMD